MGKEELITKLKTMNLAEFQIFLGEIPTTKIESIARKFSLRVDEARQIISQETRIRSIKIKVERNSKKKRNPRPRHI